MPEERGENGSSGEQPEAPEGDRVSEDIRVSVGSWPNDARTDEGPRERDTEPSSEAPPVEARVSNRGSLLSMMPQAPVEPKAPSPAEDTAAPEGTMEEDASPPPPREDEPAREEPLPESEIPPSTSPTVTPGPVAIAAAAAPRPAGSRFLLVGIAAFALLGGLGLWRWGASPQASAPVDAPEAPAWSAAAEVPAPALEATAEAPVIAVVPEAPAIEVAPEEVPVALERASVPEPEPAKDTPPRGMGDLHTSARAAGHRVYVDGKIVGEGEGTFRIGCGKRTVRIGSSGKDEEIRVPCQGEVAMR